MSKESEGNQVSLDFLLRQKLRDRSPENTEDPSAPARSSLPLWLWQVSRHATCLPIVYNSQHGTMAYGGVLIDEAGELVAPNE